MANDRKMLDDLGLSGDYGAGADGFTLESILAEFKGSAFLDGDRKTPSDELQKKTDDIVREIMGPESGAPSGTGRDAGTGRTSGSGRTSSHGTAPDPGRNAGSGKGAAGGEPIETDEALRSFFDGAEFARMSKARSASGRPSVSETPAPGRNAARTASASERAVPSGGSNPSSSAKRVPSATGRAVPAAETEDRRKDRRSRRERERREEQKPEPRQERERSRRSGGETPEARTGDRRRPRRAYADERAEPAYDTAPEIDLSVFEDPEKPEESRQGGVEDFLRSLGEESFDTPVHLGSVGGQEPARTEQVPEPRPRAEQKGGDARARRHGLFSRPDREDLEPEEDEEPEDARPAVRTPVFGRPRSVEPEEDEEPEDVRPARTPLFGRGRRTEPEEDEPEAPDRGEEDWSGDPEEFDDDYLDVGPEPDFRKAATRFARRVPALRFRILGAAVLVILLVIDTWLYTAGKNVPLIGGAMGNTASVLILELLVMAVGMEVLVRGLEDILTCSPGVESLVFVSCLISVIDGFVMLLTGNFSRGLPMAAVSAISLLGALSARKSMYMAYCDCLKGAAASASFYGVASDSEAMEGRRVLKKVSDEREGFYMKLTTPDKAESLYDDLAPLLVIVSFALAFLASVGKGNAGAFTHTFSVLTAVSASFPAASLFALPFKYVASAVKKAGGALAGYAGAVDVADSDGALITDLDIFPVGSIRLENVKLFEGVERQRALAASASLIISSDSGLRRVFEELLKSQGISRRRVDDFTCYEGGGIGGLVEGERVLVGTGAFMNLMGLRVPDGLNISGNVFAAINDELICLYTMSYTPASSVQSALVALLNTRTQVMMAVRDFNVTPNTVKQRFKVSMDGVEYLPIDTAYALSQNQLPDECGGVSAVLCRGGLAPFAEVITRGRLLKLITGLNIMINALGTALSMVILFFLCWSGAFASANALNITVFMSVIALAVYIISQGVRRRMK